MIKSEHISPNEKTYMFPKNLNPGMSSLLSYVLTPLVSRDSSHKQVITRWMVYRYTFAYFNGFKTDINANTLRQSPNE